MMMMLSAFAGTVTSWGTSGDRRTGGICQSRRSCNCDGHSGGGGSIGRIGGGINGSISGSCGRVGGSSGCGRV